MAGSADHPDRGPQARHALTFNPDHLVGAGHDDDEALPLEREDIAQALAAARLDWAEIDPSILGTLFERGLDPDKRSQLGAHYTDRDKIMLIIGPVVVEPLTREWGGDEAGHPGAAGAGGEPRRRHQGPQRRARPPPAKPTYKPSLEPDSG